MSNESQQTHNEHMTLEPESPQKTPRCWWRRVLILLVVVGLVITLLPEGLRLAAVTWLDRQPQLAARIDDIDFNPFTGQLRVEGMLVTRSGEEVLAAELVEVQWHWWPLWQRRFDLQQLKAHDMRLVVEPLPEEPLTVAGVVLGGGDPLADQAAPPSQSGPWGVNTGLVTLERVTVVLRHRHQETPIHIRHLSSSPMVSWQQQKAGSIDLTLNVAGGTLHCVGESLPFARPAQTDLRLDAEQLDLETVAPLLAALGWSKARGALEGQLRVQASAGGESQPPRFHVEGQIQGDGLEGAHTRFWLKNLGFSWQGALDIVVAEDLHLSGENHLVLQPVEMRLQQPGLGLAAGRLEWQGALALAEHLAIKGHLQLAGLGVTDLERETTPLQIGAADVVAFDLDPQGELRIGAITANTVNLLGRHDAPSQRRAQVVSLARMRAEELRWAPGQYLSIAALHLGGLVGDVVLLPGGAVEAQQWLPQAQALSSQASSPAESDEPLAVRIDALVVDGQSQIYLEDQGMTPPVGLQVSDLQLRLDDLDSRQKQQHSPLSLEARLDDYSKVAVQGDVSVFGEPVSVRLTGGVSEFQLPALSSYIERGIGYRLDQGHLNLHLEGSVEQGIADLDSRVHLKRLQLSPLSVEDERRTGERLGLPVNMALSLLRDRQGDISLEIPLRGDVSRPDVAMGSVIRKAVFGAVKNTVALTLAPLGIVAKAGQWVGIGGQLMFEPVVFQPGTLELTAESQTYLEQLKKLLEERPRLTLSLCGQVNATDRQALNAEKSLTTDQIQQLANQRAESVKQFLVDGERVKSAQVILCNPPAVLVDGPSAVLVRL